MEEPMATPKLPTPVFESGPLPVSKDQLFSSSPGFGTPAYPIKDRSHPVLRQPFALQQNTSINAGPTVLSILLPPQTLRPVAFRTLTKKHNLTLTSSGLGLLSTFVGKFCGSGWREEGLGERVLDEIAKAWKRQNGGVIVEDGPDRKLSAILKSLEPCMSGGRVDTGKLSRTNSSLSGATISRQSSHNVRPDPSREDSQTSLGISGLDVEDDPEYEGEEITKNRDVRSFLKVVSALSQPRFTYSTSRKSLELVNSAPSLLPPMQHKISMFRNRYHLIHQRLMRNESFQAPTFSTTRGPPSLMHSASSAATVQQAYKITPVSNLLGRSGTPHLLLGILVHSAAGDLALADLSGSVVLDMSSAHTVPDDGAWFCPGMIVLVEGIYEEDSTSDNNLGSASGVGGQIKGQFIADTFAGPPAERREITLGVGPTKVLDNTQNSTGAGFGWVDFLGVGSEKAMGKQMRSLQKAILGSPGESDEDRKRRKMIMIGECHLDSPRTLEAIRAILSTYATGGEIETQPLSVVMTGNFVSAASMAGSSKGGGSVEYKEHFDALASVLSEFPVLLSNTTFVFVPGDNDPWASSFCAGAAAILPRPGIPELFTSRVRRAIATANSEGPQKASVMAGEAIWTSNPSRMTFFGPAEEIVLFRDDITGRLRRNTVMFTNPQEGSNEDIDQPSSDLHENESGRMQIDMDIQEAASNLPTHSDNATAAINKTDTATARKLVKTVLDQGHLAPFSLSIRPVLWDHASALMLYPLPTALVLADAEAPAFAITYEGCHVMNPGRVLDELGARKGIAKWVEYDVRNRRAVVRDVRF